MDGAATGHRERRVLYYVASSIVPHAIPPSTESTSKMHPPLDRPHPDCEKEVDALRQCHATTSKLKFWACNEIKFAMDQCLKVEKQRMLKEMNKDFEEKRQREEDAFRDAVGQELTFDQYLKQDREYLSAEKAAQDRRKANPDLYTRKANGS